jgi:hypothetical protein
MALTRDAFAAWLGRYVAAWRSYAPADIGDLFSEHAVYSYRAGTRVVEGRAAIVASWLADPDEPGSWDAHYEPLAIDREVHVAIGTSRYLDVEGAVRDEYSNIFVCRFDAEGRCSSFTEWWMRTRQAADPS